MKRTTRATQTADELRFCADGKGHATPNLLREAADEIERLREWGDEAITVLLMVKSKLPKGPRNQTVTDLDVLEARINSVVKGPTT